MGNDFEKNCTRTRITYSSNSFGIATNVQFQHQHIGVQRCPAMSRLHSHCPAMSRLHSHCPAVSVIVDIKPLSRLNNHCPDVTPTVQRCPDLTTIVQM